MSYPSIKTLRVLFGDAAPTARRLIDGRLDPSTFETVQAWERQCYHRPSRHERKMKALDELLDTVNFSCGVESIRNSEGDTVCEYLNVGETYTTTLLYVPDARQPYRVGCYGDFVEAYQQRHGERSIP